MVINAISEHLPNALVSIGASGRVKLGASNSVGSGLFPHANPAIDRSPITVSVAAVVTRAPNTAALGVEYTSAEWTSERLWSYSLAYGLAPGMQWPADDPKEVDSVLVVCPEDWTGMVTEIGQAFICVDPSPNEVRFRGFWDLAQTRFVEPARRLCWSLFLSRLFSSAAKCFLRHLEWQILGWARCRAWSGQISRPAKRPWELEATYSQVVAAVASFRAWRDGIEGPQDSNWTAYDY